MDRKLALYICFYINCHSIKTKKLTEKPLEYCYTSLNFLLQWYVPSVKLAVIFYTEGEDALTKECLVFHHLFYMLVEEKEL